MEESEMPVSEKTMLDHFVKQVPHAADEDDQDSIVLNEDGTMGMATDD
jgi:hypothetical protein